MDWKIAALTVACFAAGWIGSYWRHYTNGWRDGFNFRRWFTNKRR